MGVFDEIAARVDAEAPDPLNQLAFTGVQQNPDELAGAMALGKRVGVPTEFALDPKLRPGFEQDDKLATTQQKLQNLGPRAQGWVSKDRHNIGLVYDELDTLGSIESAFDRAKRVESDKVRAENYRRGTGVVTGLATSLVRGVDQLISAPQDVAEATTYATIGRAFGPGAAKKFIDTFSPVSPGYWLGQFGRAGEKALKQSDRQTSGILVSDPKTGQTFMNMQAVNPATPEGLENISKMFMQEAPAFAAQMAVTGMTGGLGSAALAPKAGKLAGLVAKVGQYAKSPAGIMEVGRTVSGQYNNAVDQFVAQGMDPEQARVKVAPGALLAGVFSAAAGAPMEAKIMEDLLHRVAVLPGGKSIVQKIAGRLWSATTTGAKEGTQEVLNGVGEDLSEWITYNPDKTIQEAAGNAVMNFVGGAAMGGAGGAAAHGANTQEFVQELADIAKSSKLNQRASDKFQEAVQEMAGDQENLLIPADRYFQTVTDAGLDPAELAQSLGVSNLQEAMEAGTDVVIPVGAYAAQIAATDLHGKLAQDIRLNPGDSTMREETEAGKLAEDEAAKTTEDAQGLQVQAEIDALPVPAVEQFQTKRQAQLEAAGFAPDAAAEQARFHAQVFNVLAGSEGLTVEQMDQMFPLEVSGVRSGEGKKSLTDLALDRLKAMGGTVQEFFQRGGGRYASDKEARAARAKRAGQNTQASMDKAKMDAHLAEEAEFSTFDSAVKELQAGDILNDKRGFIQVTPDRQFHIGLLEGRDLSTFLHESGHYFLEVMGDLAERPEASERVKGMWADTLKSFGVDSREAITTEHHEQFAGQMERYLMEGKAPSEKLKPMFQRFKSWLMLVYKQMDKIGVRINDDVRSVFDRLMATDAEIEAHRPQVETFATAKDMGVSEKEFEIYQKAKAGAMEEGRDRLQGEVMADLVREQKAAYKEEKALARADVEAGVDSRPDMKAIAALTDPGNAIKLNRQAVQDQFGDVRGLPVVEEGGMDAEAAAEMLGFDSGAQLYQALKDAPTRKDLIDTLTDEIMFARYGDVTLDGTIADKAVEALHNDKQADVLAMELRAMKRLQRIAEKVGKAKEGQDKAAQKAADVQIPGVSTFRGQARQMISGMTLRQMEPHKYELAELKYRKEADKLTKKKDYEGAVKAKTREMLNHFLYREAKKGQEEAGKIYDYARSLESDTAQGKLGLAGGLDKDGNPKNTFKSQVNALLDRYQFSKETNKALDARQTLLEFVREQEANGEAVMIDPAILNEARRINYREVPMSELRAVRDALKNIQTIAYRQLDMDIDGKHVAKDEAKSEMIASALLNFKAKPLPFSGSDLTLKESASKWLKGKSAMFTKMERVIDWLDGGKIDGPWRSYIFNRIAKAEINEFDLNTAITQKFIEAFEKMDPKHRLSMTDSVGVTLPGMDRPLNRRQAITLLMNMGNDQNQEKLLEGYGWTSPQAIGMVGDALGNLTPGDLEFVNTTWKTINALWPSIEALEFKMTGLSPEKVDARPFMVTLKDGSQHMMDGGYFPIVYDPSRSPQGAKQIEGNVNELTDKGFSRPNTPHGFTKSRVQFSAPILLNFEHTLTRHLSQVIKDVTHREAVTDIYSLITSQDIRDTLNETIGEAQQKQFLPWLKSVVNDRNGAGTQGLEEFSAGIMAVRSNLITATLAFRLSSVIVQATDLVRAMDRVKPRFMAEAFASFTAAQRLGHNELVDEMREKSGEMRHRPGSFDRDMRVVLQKGFGDQPIKKRVAEFGAHGLSYADAITSTITWVGAYRQALSAGSDETEAIAEADRTVRLVLQAGSPKDLTPIQKGGALEKLLTMYAGDSFATYGIMQDAGRNYKKGGVKDTPKWAARMLFAVLMPAIIADIIKGRVPDDDEDKAKWLAWKAGLCFFNTLPIIRDVSSSLESGYDYKFTPVAEAIAKAGRAIHSTGKMIEGEKDPVDVAFQGLDAVGTLWGVPGTSQLMQTSKYLYKVSQGEENPDNAAQLVKNAILGKPKK